MTYLEVVNKVLIRLREDTVTSVDSNEYSRLVGEFVNDAFNQVQDAWDWSSLRTTISADTIPGIFNYVLTGSGDKSELLNAINDTSNWFLEYRNQTWFDDRYLNRDVISGPPRNFTFNGLSDNGDIAIDVYPTPDSLYTLRFNVVLRRSGLSLDSDPISVPSLPVIHLAHALAVRERGESGAQSTPELLYTAERTLSDAVALDAVRHPEETIFVSR